MSSAAAGDVARALDVLHLIDADEPDDPLDVRDPDYIRDTLPALRLLSETYFRADVEGLENIPADEPVLLVGNHSGGTHIADTYVFAQAFYDHFGPGRAFHQLAHDLVFKAPGLRVLATRYGTVPASPENMRSALERGAALLVYPGGDHETFRPSWETDQVDFGGRKGFARLALELDTPIVPVVAIGGQETALFLGQGHGLAKALRLDRFARLKVVPAQIGPPYGLTVLDLPGRVPLPAKITVRILPRIDLRERLGDDATPEAAYELVTGEMQDALTELSEERTLPFVG
jgi:1-acyl-sn-glycerol-3-phosphate acyltransferase